jgi:hypothetical protein
MRTKSKDDSRKTELDKKLAYLLQERGECNICLDSMQKQIKLVTNCQHFFCSKLIALILFFITTFINLLLLLFLIFAAMILVHKKIFKKTYNYKVSYIHCFSYIVFFKNI